MQVEDRQNAGVPEKPQRFSPLKMVARALGGRHESDAFTASLEPYPQHDAEMARMPDLDIPPVGEPIPQPEFVLEPPVVGEGFVALVNAMLADEGPFALPPEEGECDLGELFAEVQAVLEARAREEGRALWLTMSDAACATYRGDVLRLRQAVMNLISGALKATADSTLVVKADWRDGVLTVEVAAADAAVAMARLLARQARPSARAPAQGLGQALASATALGGVMRVTAGVGLEMTIPFQRVGAGTVRVPEAPQVDASAAPPPPVEVMREPEPEPAPEPAPQPVYEAAPAFKPLEPFVEPTLQAEPEPAFASEPELDEPSFTSGLRVLVADGNASQRQVMSAVLRGMDADAVVVADGQEAVAAWRQERWDVLLIDIEDEELCGRGLIRSIRAAEATARWPNVPILALVTQTRARDLDEAFAELLDGLVAKPVNATVLEDALAQVLDAAPVAPQMAGFSRSAAY